MTSTRPQNRERVRRNLQKNQVQLMSVVLPFMIHGAPERLYGLPAVRMAHPSVPALPCTSGENTHTWRYRLPGNITHETCGSGSDGGLYCPSSMHLGCFLRVSARSNNSSSGDTSLRGSRIHLRRREVLRRPCRPPFISAACDGGDQGRRLQR